MTKRFLSVKEMLNRVSLSKTHVYYLISKDRFPRPVKLGPKRAAFLESEIDAWMDERIQARRNITGEMLLPPSKGVVNEA